MRFSLVHSTTKEILSSQGPKTTRVAFGRTTLPCQQMKMTMPATIECYEGQARLSSCHSQLAIACCRIDVLKLWSLSRSFDPQMHTVVGCWRFDVPLCLSSSVSIKYRAVRI